MDKEVTKNDIINAYQMILGRNPENEDVINEHLKEFNTIEELRKKFISSKEFKENFDFNIIDAFNVYMNQCRIDVDITSEQLNELLSHIKTNWNKLGNSKPFWSVLSHAKYNGQNLTDKLKKEFYDSGEATLKYINTILNRVGEKLPTKNCLEYGCGVGRNLLHLAPHFNSIVGVDISQPLLDIAENIIYKAGIKNVSLKKLTSLSQINYLGEFELIFSIIVLQHNPPPIIAVILNSLFRLLEPGGIIIFQCPIPKDGYEFNINTYLETIKKEDQVKNQSDEGKMEMHALPQYKIFEIARLNSCHPLEVHCDTLGNTKYVLSQSFAFKKDKHI